MTRLLVATRSAHKARELREILASSVWELVFPDDVGIERLPEEERIEVGATFQENAMLKARYFARRSGIATVADDSGLEVDMLDGEPGIRSARWAGVTGAKADETNNRLLLERLEGIPQRERTARYQCVAAYVPDADSEGHTERGTTEGHILTRYRGSRGFGYDPLFYSAELQMSFGEALPEEKHRVSHRGRAFRALAEYLRQRGS